MSSPAEVPFWASSSSLSFRHTPAVVRRVAGAVGLHAKWFSQRVNEKSQVEAVFWNSKRFGKITYLRK